jgi:hypothetical protein
LAVEFRRNVLARLAMYRAQPFQKPVNVVVVENAWKQRLEGQVVSHTPYLTRPVLAIKPKLPGCDVIPDTTAPPLLASRQPRDDLVVHCNDATGEMRVIGIGIAQGEDDLAVGVNADHA